ncbi:MAG: hypothetical protein ACFFD6_08390, partial [Candidatus Thorarchaeota archaeon]
RERMEQSVAHIPFLFAAFLWKPIAWLLGVLAIVNIGGMLAFPEFTASLISVSASILVILGQFILALVGNAFLLGLLFPILPSKGNSFWRRGIGFAFVTLPLALAIMLILHTYWTSIAVWLAAQYVMATSLTMDFSGMTSVSDPKVIRREYPNMILTLKAGTAFIVIFNILAVLMGW